MRDTTEVVAGYGRRGIRKTEWECKNHDASSRNTGRAREASQLASPPWVEFSFTGWRDSGPYGLISDVQLGAALPFGIPPFYFPLVFPVVDTKSLQLVVEGAAGDSKPLCCSLNGAGFLCEHRGDVVFLHLAQGEV